MRRTPKEFLEDFTEGCEGLDPGGISPGGVLDSCLRCRETFHLSDNEHISSVCSEDLCDAESTDVCYCHDEGSFSWRPCEICGSTLGGNRYIAHGHGKEGLRHFLICTDCLFFSANGELPT